MDEAGKLRRKDTTKGPPLRILSLDGGGVRGYSMLIILQKLMHNTFVEMEGRAPERHEIPLPCNHFDLIAGTGTGGLIALMLGRLRLDLDTCKDLYVRMTRRVFETDKTIAGIPYKSTMFKASKLEEVTREAVKEHTLSELEGNDTLAKATPMTLKSTMNSPASSSIPQRTLSNSSSYSRMGMSPMGGRISYGSLTWGNPNTLLYDMRENRTKTAVTAVFMGTPTTTLLRSYDSRKDPAPDVNCSIWQAGRATSAIAMAFKPIRIGQSWYLDEGAGKYNPAPLILDEAVQNEWPGREIGVFVSIGTGKRPSGTGNQQHEWWEGFLGGSMGAFAEARRRLIAKLEGCEDTHQFMLREHLATRRVNPENYYRLNVEVGVGEFGLNEWARLSEVSTNTRTYLDREDVQTMNQDASAKLARIQFAKIRQDRAEARKESNFINNHDGRYSWQQDPLDRPLPAAPAPAHNGFVAELPGDDHYFQTQSFRPGSQQYAHRPSIADQKYVVAADEYQTTVPNHPRTPPQQPAIPADHHVPSYYSPDSVGRYPSQSQHRPNQSSIDYSPPRPDSDYQQRTSPPPLPPKTPISNLPYPDETSPSVQSPPNDFGPRTFMNMGDLGRRLPYPDVDGPPPVVNTANKPQMSR